MVTQLSQQMKHFGFVLTVENRFWRRKTLAFDQRITCSKEPQFICRHCHWHFSRELLFTKKNIFAKGKLLLLGLCRAHDFLHMILKVMWFNFSLGSVSNRPALIFVTRNYIILSTLDSNWSYSPFS